MAKFKGGGGAAVLPGQTPVLDKDDARVPKEPDDKPRNAPEEYRSVATKLAKSNFCNRNWKFKNADEHFPVDVVSRRCALFFPYAYGGPLLIDEPQNSRELAACKKKAGIILSEGQRYAYIEKIGQIDRKKHEDEDSTDRIALSAAQARLADHDKMLKELEQAKAG